MKMLTDMVYVSFLGLAPVALFILWTIDVVQ